MREGNHSGAAAARVSVEAPARLHMGFVDLNGGLGRHFGSIGLTLAGLATRVVVTPAAGLEVSGPGAVRARRCAQRLAAAWGVPPRARVDIETAIPEHVGLGSGTQLSLALGVALAALWGVEEAASCIAERVERGARSGIGIGAFEQGGLLVDGGRRTGGPPPRIVARLAFPDPWRLLLVFDRRGQGLHGEAERNAFQALPEFPATRAAALARLVLMQALPAVAEADLRDFGAAISELQRQLAEHFAPVQGGSFTSPAVAAALTWLGERGAVGLGQSSWGPTGFCVLGDPAQAERLVQAARARFAAVPTLEFRALAARNEGARLSTERLRLLAGAARARGER